jgi:hypothetical protein
MLPLSSGDAVAAVDSFLIAAAGSAAWHAHASSPASVGAAAAGTRAARVFSKSVIGLHIQKRRKYCHNGPC